MYWNRLGELAQAAHRAQSRAGIGSDGSRLAKVKDKRPDGAMGPPLSPHQADSRTQRNLAFSVGREGVTLWWRGGWGRILGYHANGEVIGAPIRDVLGFSPRFAARVKRQATTYWRNIAGPPLPDPVPTPAPVPVLPIRRPVPPPTPLPLPMVAAPPRRRSLVGRFVDLLRSAVTRRPAVQADAPRRFDRRPWFLR
jgi:hypothetical protein